MVDDDEGHACLVHETPQDGGQFPDLGRAFVGLRREAAGRVEHEHFDLAFPARVDDGLNIGGIVEVDASAHGDEHGRNPCPTAFAYQSVETLAREAASVLL